MLVLLGLFSIWIGWMAFRNPQAAWRASEGWRYKKLEPSSATLLMYKSYGFFGILLGFALFGIWFQMGGLERDIETFEFLRKEMLGWD